MGKGTDAARTLAPEHAGLIDDLKDQLLIVFLKRMGGKASIPVEEVDDPGNNVRVLSFDAKSRIFYFAVEKKQ